MKAIATILFAAATILISAESAKASMPLRPTFRANLCGYQTTINEFDVNITHVCFGQMVGPDMKDGTPVVSFLMTDGSQRLYRVNEVARLLMAFTTGSTKSIFHLVNATTGVESAMKVIQAANGDIKSVAGNLEGFDYLVPEFHAVFTIQTAPTVGI